MPCSHGKDKLNSMPYWIHNMILRRTISTASAKGNTWIFVYWVITVKASIVAVQLGSNICFVIEYGGFQFSSLSSQLSRRIFAQESNWRYLLPTVILLHAIHWYLYRTFDLNKVDNGSFTTWTDTRVVIEISLNFDEKEHRFIDFRGIRANLSITASPLKGLRI